jgi:hypothetical protein
MMALTVISHLLYNKNSDKSTFVTTCVVVAICLRDINMSTEFEFSIRLCSTRYAASFLDKPLPQKEFEFNIRLCSTTIDMQQVSYRQTSPKRNLS